MTRTSAKPVGRWAEAPSPRSAKEKSPRHAQAAAAASCLLALVALLVFVGTTWRDARRREQLQTQIAEGPPERARAAVSELCRDSQRAPETIASLLAASREVVAQAATEELESLLLGWESRRGTEALEDAADLARRLAHWLPRYGPTSQAVARESALRMLALASAEAESSGALLAHCETILRKTERPARFDTAAAQVASGTATPVALQARVEGPWPEFGEMPAGGLLPLDADPPALPRGLSRTAPVEPKPPVRVDIPREPRRLPEGDAPKALDAGERNVMRLVDPRPHPQEASPAPAAPARPKQEEPPAVSQPATSAAYAAIDWGEMDEGRLLDALRKRDPSTTSEIEAELRRRGFDEAHLVLARRLTSSDAEERLDWTNRLPTIPDIAPGAWLEWLCGDADPRVRWSAMTLLATADPRAGREALARAAQSDPDPTLRREATRQLERLGER